MKHIKYFKESFDSDRLEDYLISFFEIEPSYKDYINGNGIIVYYNINDLERAKDSEIEEIGKEATKYLNGSRFKNYKVISQPIRENYCYLIIDKLFYTKHSNLWIENIKWEKHPLSNPFTFPNAKIAQLPNNCSLIYGLSWDKSWELWPLNDVDPFKIYDEITLQFEIFKWATL